MTEFLVPNLIKLYCRTAEEVANVSVNSKPDHPPGDLRGFGHSSCPWGQVLAPLSCPGGLKSKLKFNNFEKKRDFRFVS